MYPFKENIIFLFIAMNVTVLNDELSLLGA